MTYQGKIGWKLPPLEETASPKKGEDFVVSRGTIEGEQLLILADNGKAYPLPISELPSAAQPPSSILSLLPKSAQRDASRAVTHFFLSDEPADLVLLTEQGRIKRILGSDLNNLTNRGLVLLKLKDRDRLQHVNFAQTNSEIAIATTGGRILRFLVDDEQMPIMGRSAQGNQSLRLRYGEQIAGFACLKATDRLLLVSELGYGKRLLLSELRLANRGDIGTQALQFTSKTDNLAAMMLAPPQGTVVLTTSDERRLLLSVESVLLARKEESGAPLVKLKSEEKIVSAVCITL